MQNNMIRTKDLSKLEDKLYFEILESYGITKDNIMDFQGRLKILETNWDSSGKHHTEIINLDGDDISILKVKYKAIRKEGERVEYEITLEVEMVDEWVWKGKVEDD